MSDARLSKQTVNTRKSRASLNRSVTEDRTQTDAERLDIFRAASAQSALPDIPPIPGYHVVWLSSNNPRDSLQMRHRLGYEPVKAEDVKGFEFVSDKGSESDGLIRVNEMVAYKIPSSLYNLYMQDNHHNKPALEATKLTDAVDSMRQRIRQQGGDVDTGDGVEALREESNTEAPDFTDV